MHVEIFTATGIATAYIPLNVVDLSNPVHVIRHLIGDQSELQFSKLQLAVQSSRRGLWTRVSGNCFQLIRERLWDNSPLFAKPSCTWMCHSPGGWGRSGYQQGRHSPSGRRRRRSLRQCRLESEVHSPCGSHVR